MTKLVKFVSTVNPNGFITTAQFYVGTPETDFSPVGDSIELPEGQHPVPVDLTTELEAETDFLVKLIATNEAGEVESNVTPFRTPDENGAPIVTDVTVEFL